MFVQADKQRSDMLRRIFLVLLVLSAGIGLLGARLFMIQVWEKRHYSVNAVNLVHQSVMQRLSGMVLNDGRGHFYDRHLRPLTGEKVNALAVFPLWYRRDRPAPETEQKLAELLNVPPEKWERWVSELDAPALWNNGEKKDVVPLTEEQVAKIKKLHIAGIRVVPYEKRYPNSYLASHAIGFTSQHPERLRSEYADRLESGRLEAKSLIGASGLEKTFDPFLHGLEKSMIFHLVDAHHRPLKGAGIRMYEPDHPLYPLRVVTTLDQSIQQAVEQIVDEGGMKAGAVVVMDTATADILAMVSRPNFDPIRVDPLKDDWRNLAVKATIPGSVFKIVTAAAVLEHGRDALNTSYFCSGELGRYRFSCWKPDGHGHITLAEAFAQSCNISFAQAALRLDSQALERTADKFGLLVENGWKDERGLAGKKPFVQLDGEEAGRVFLPDGDENDPGAIVQAAIGQRDVRVSPLAAANMIVTILNDGVAKRPRIVSEIRYSDGTLMKRFPTQRLFEHKSGIHPYTAATLKEWMQLAVKEGTGSQLKDAVWSLAGKTGTAQAPDGSGQMKEHQWFVGYGPVETPRYAVAVYVHETDGRQGHIATRLFGKIMDQLAQLEQDGSVDPSLFLNIFKNK